MCYEFDEFFNRARAAEQLRRQTKLADKLKEQSKEAAPAKPAEAEEQVKEQQPVPA
jgi:hypothetical protein